MEEADIDGSKTTTLGPRSGFPPVGGVVGGVVVIGVVTTGIVVVGGGMMGAGLL